LLGASRAGSLSIELVHIHRLALRTALDHAVSLVVVLVGLGLTVVLRVGRRPDPAEEQVVRRRGVDANVVRRVPASSLPIVC
jgi:hypothetical protein